MPRCAVVLLLAAALSPGVGWCQANWEGPTGAFLNPFAMVIPKGQVQACAHYLNLQPIGSLATVGIVYGAAERLEVGITNGDLAVGKSNALWVAHAKYIIRPGQEPWPALAVGAIARDMPGGESTSDFYLAASRVFPTKVPIIANLSVRNTNGLGNGLFGRNHERTTEFGGFLGVMATKQLCVGLDYYEQPEAGVWKGLCVRYYVTDDTNIDAGVADLGDALDNQIAVAVTRRW